MLSGRCALAAIGIGALGCGGAHEGTPPVTTPTAIVASVSPAITATTPSGKLAFTAVEASGNPATVSWKVNGLAGGTLATGTIDTFGTYTAPAVVPAGDSVIIEGATSSSRKTATVYFLPPSTARDYTMMIPRVVDANNSATNHLFVVPALGVSSVAFVPLAGGAGTPFTSLGNGVFLFELDAATAAAGYTPGALHNTLGYLEHRTAAGVLTKRPNFSVNVRETSMSDVAITSLASDAQRSSHVLNIRSDVPMLANVDPSIVVRAIQLLGDRFDQVSVVSNVSSSNNRYHVGARNAVKGIGLTTFESGATYGSASRLLGVNYFPLEEYLDAGEAGMNHEFGHQWVNFATDPVLAVGTPHWPPSDVANGIMGFSIGGTGGEGGDFSLGLAPSGVDMYLLYLKTSTKLYDAWDLYMMGLLPADSVPPAHVLAPGATLASGQVVFGTTYTISNYVTAHGARVPAYVAGTKEFSMAIVITSYGRLLSAAEMAFYNANAMRAESAVVLPSSIGLATRETAKPFKLATGGRATLRVRLD